MYVFVFLTRDDIMISETKSTNCSCELNEKERANRYCCHCGKANNQETLKWALKPEFSRSHRKGAKKHELLWLNNWLLIKNEYEDTYRLIGTPSNRICNTYISLSTSDHDDFIARVADVWPKKNVFISSEYID